MSWTKWLALLPPLGFLGGAGLFNDTRPLVFGLPLLLAWMVACVVMTSAVMGIVYLCDPVRKAEPGR